MDIQRAKAILDQVSGMPVDQRAAALDRLCADDADLRVAAEGLLAGHDQLTASLVPGDGASSVLGSFLSPGTRVGHYHIIRMLGAGGMGVVYEAQQEQPRRSVALKIINAGVMTREHLRRFAHEAEILGRLQHAGIAQVYEAGTFESAVGVQPFFAMELIKGEALMTYSTTRLLSPRQRLELLVRICKAVQHAHTKGVIHRDLKPGNILVTPEGEPKILDFGVARATDGDLQATTVQTEVGQLIGTVQYMSPEQAAGDPAQLDTRSDVYALGVISYELLAARLPYDLKKKFQHEALRVIREDDPTPLSSVNRTLRGDVEIIVGKALEKEKERRYQSAQEFASDIERYLKDEPIVARPPSTWYQASKFARRNKALVGGMVATFLALAAGLIVSLVLLQRANEARRGEAAQTAVAKDNARKAENASNAEKQRADELEKVAQFQSSQLSGIETELMGIRLRQAILEKRGDALTSQGYEDTSLVEGIQALDHALAGVNFTNVALESLSENVFERALQAIESQFTEQPLLKARLLQTIATTMRDLGLLERAIAPQAEALDIRRSLLGDEHVDTLTSITEAGGLRHQQGNLDRAEELFREARETRERVQGELHPDTLASLNNLGALLNDQGKFSEAHTMMFDAVAKHRSVLGDTDRRTIGCIGNLGSMLEMHGLLDDAEPLLREAFERGGEVLGENDRFTIAAAHNLAALHRSRGDVEKAEPLLRNVIAQMRQINGDVHPDTLSAIAHLATLLSEEHRLVEAESLLRETLARQRDLLGADHAATLLTVNNLGLLLQEQNRLADAEECIREGFEGRLRALGSDHLDTIGSMNNLAGVLQALGNRDEASLLFSQALDAHARVAGEDHPNTFTIMNNLGRVLLELGKLAEAEPLLRRVAEQAPTLWGTDEEATLSAINEFGNVLYDQKRFDEAEAQYRIVLEKVTRLRGEEHLDTITCTKLIAEVVQRQGRLEDAEELFRQVATKTRRQLGEDHFSTIVALNFLGRVMQQQGKFGEAELVLREVTQKCRDVLGEDHEHTLGSINNLGVVLQAQGNFPEAESLFHQAVEHGKVALGERHPLTIAYMKSLPQFYLSWEQAEPDHGYAAKAEEWRSKIAELQASTESATQPQP